MNTAIHLQNVTKRYEGFVLDRISFDVPKGAIVGLIGENGAGKTTLLKCILQMTGLDEGEIQIDGVNLEHLPSEWKKNVGVILPNVEFAGFMSAKEMEKISKKIYDNWDEKAFEKYLRHFSIRPEQKIREYSRGMKMKLNIALALSHHAKLLIFDEATSGLDPVVRDDILDILLDFIQDEEHSVLISSHIISDLEKVADYIAFVHEGRLLFYRNKDELLEEYGVVHCTEAEYEKLPEELIQGLRRNAFGCEVLVSNRYEVLTKAADLAVDPVTLEEMIVFLVKGEKK